MLIHSDQGKWENYFQAFYTAHLELYLGNACLGKYLYRIPIHIDSTIFFLSGVGVMMLLALTLERYVSVCHPSYTRPVVGNPRVTIVIIPLLTGIIYSPSMLRGRIVTCVSELNGPILYYRRDNTEFLASLFYAVSLLI